MGSVKQDGTRKKRFPPLLAPRSVGRAHSGLGTAAGSRKEMKVVLVLRYSPRGTVRPARRHNHTALWARIARATSLPLIRDRPEERQHKNRPCDRGDYGDGCDCLIPRARFHAELNARRGKKVPAERGIRTRPG